MSAFEFPDEMLAQHLAIVGKAGSGKTYTSKGMIERLLVDKRRVCILDPTGVWWGLRSSADGKSAGFPVVVFGGAHADVPIAEQSGGALAKIIAEKNLPAIIDLSEMLIGQRHRFVTAFAETLYRDNRAPLHLVIDEADEFCPQNPMPETKRMLHHVDRIVRRGRVRGFRVMLITQRPAVLHKNVLTQANTLIAMRLTAPQDRNAIKAWVEGQADVARGKSVLESLAQLPRGEGWVWAPELGFLERVAFPQISTFDSSRTPGDDEVVAEPTKLAAVDLSEIKASFAAVEKEASSVKDLQAAVVTLRRKLSAAEKVPGGGVTEAEVQRRIDQALRAAAKSPPVGAPLDIGRIKSMREAARQICLLADVVLGTAESDSGSAPAPRHRASAPVDHANGTAALPPTIVSTDVTRPQQIILNALAQLSAFGLPAPNKMVVAAQAHVSTRSSAYTNNLGRLRSMGLIDYPAGGLVALTDLGRRAAATPDKPASIEALHEGFLAMVSGPQRAILRELIAVHPKALQKAELADRAGASPMSSAYTNNLGAMRSLGVLDYPSSGLVRATDVLFPGRANGR